MGPDLRSRLGESNPDLLITTAAIRHPFLQVRAPLRACRAVRRVHERPQTSRVVVTQLVMHPRHSRPPPRAHRRAGREAVYPQATAL